MLGRILIAKKAKEHEEIKLDQEDMDLLIRIREAYSKHLREKAQEEKAKERERTRLTPAKNEIHFAAWRRAEEVEEEGKSSGPPPLWKEFLEANYNGGHKKVKNTSKTKGKHPEVRVTTLMKTDKVFMRKIMEEYHRWVKEQEEEGEGGGQKTKTESPSAKSVFGVSYTKEYSYEDKIKLDKRTANYLKTHQVSVKDLLDAAGFSAIEGQPYNRPFIHMDDGNLTVESNLYDTGAPVQVVCRKFDFDKKNMKNDTLLLGGNAPKGLGTKLLTSQIEKARQLGMMTMTCEAYRDDPGFVGYKVWPRLGYDGPIPVEKTGLPQKYQEALAQAGHEQPWRIQQLYALGKDAIDWWDEHGTTFKAEFDLADDSMSMKLFEAYIKKKGGYEKLVASA